MSDQPTPAEQQSGTDRAQIAVLVFLVATLGLVAVSAAVIFVAIQHADSKDANTSAMSVFNAVVPLFGTWVGTVLAFYFSRENYQAAAQNARALVGQLTGDERLAAIKVKTVMIARKDMVVEQVTADRTPANIRINDMIAKLHGNVTRLPVLNADGSLNCVVHQSILYQFMYQNQANQQDLTLAQLLENEDLKKLVAANAFIDIDANLAKAKAAMEQVPDSQDVFVTKTGTRTESVEGWLTNIDIAKHSRA